MRMSRLFGAAFALGIIINVAPAQGPGPMDPPILRYPLLESAAPPSGLPYTPGQQTTARGAPQPDINQDILVSEKQGPWMIFVHWYIGPKAPEMARQMVMELRNHYRLPAFVFNHGAEEKRKEDARIRGIIEKQRQFLIEKKLPLDTPLRVKRIPFEEQCAVLIGDFPDDDAARRGLSEMRRLKPPDPNRVSLAKVYEGGIDDRTGEGRILSERFDNPFNRAYVIYNPILKKQQSQDQETEAAVLKSLNRGEDFSLYNCPKPYTLVIKQFMMPNVTQPRSGSGSGSFLAALGLGKSSDAENVGQNAHNLAELMRKSFQLDAYVLHTRHSSIVTVGGFDGIADPRMRSTQEMLVNRLKVPSALPMEVPR